ncbi:MAG: GNAT family N-acetyltransferase [Chloroflexi bacterium]|nr:GNAT family N-acetyltransferase [Chloroflexota bacterium]MBU1746400.1 GNAT family N-acetyltransferase [Chloroflexota bacterium]
MDKEYSIVLTASPDPADVQVIREGLDAYNATQGAPVDWVPLMISVRHQQGQIVGGLTGGTYWGWLFIGRLWIKEHLRGQNYGSRVLGEAEQAAVRRGCHHSYVDTQDFQALPFYEKHGYVVYGELKDMPIGHGSETWGVSLTVLK